MSAEIEAPGTELLPYKQRAHLASTAAKSRLFANARDPEKAMVAIQFGHELGISPMSALMHIHVIDGKPTMSAAMVAHRLKSSPVYNYRVLEHTAERCKIAFFEGKEQVGTSEFSMANARAAGLVRKGSPWEKYPRNMLFARAITNGARWHAPDLFLGAVYTADEIASGVHDEGVGEVIDIQLGELDKQVEKERAADDLELAEVLAGLPVAEQGNAEHLETYLAYYDDLDKRGRALLKARAYAAQNVADGKEREDGMSDREHAWLKEGDDLVTAHAVEDAEVQEGGDDA